MKNVRAVEGTEGWQDVVDGRHPNFRIMGGTTADGRSVRSGAFLRGPALHDLTEAEWRSLQSKRDLALIVDFRRADEVQERPNRLPEDLSTLAVGLPINSGASARIAAEFKLSTINHERAASAMRAVYTDFASLHLKHYGEFLAHLPRAAGRGVFFHCTAGKDRTGFAAALILLALGVAREQVMADFMASGTLWRPDDALKSRVPLPAHTAVFGIEAAYLEAALDELERSHGSAAAFASQAMGAAAFRAWLDQSLI